MFPWINSLSNIALTQSGFGTVFWEAGKVGEESTAVKSTGAA